MDWKLTDAKNKLSEVLDRADAEGPQVITRRGRSYTVVPEAVYRRLTGEKPGFVDWLIHGPRIDDLELPPRDRDPMRPVDL